jgi:hypothetical protein
LALGSVERAVNAVDEPFEHSLVASLGDGFDCEFDLLLGLSLGDEVTTDFDARREECLGHVGDAQAQQVSNLLCDSVVRQCGLI